MEYTASLVVGGVRAEEGSTNMGGDQMSETKNLRFGAHFIVV